MKVISLFSGVGGLDLGFILAGFDVVWANDFNKDAVKTYRKNIGEHIVLGDISKIKSNDIPGILGEIDVIIAGYPSQGFAIANKNRNLEGLNNILYLDTLRIIKDKQPKFFLVETVKVLISAKDGEWLKRLVEDFKEIGYDVEYKILNAANYGVPQFRERLIIIGNRLGLKNLFPIETHADIISNNHKLKPYVTVGETIGFLSKFKFSKKEIQVEKRFIHGHIGPKGREIILSKKILNENEISKVISRKPYVHMNQNRVLSIRECALLQTFPDNYIFKGSLGSQYHQIGYAFPPVLAFRIAEKIKKSWEENVLSLKNTKEKVNEWEKYYFERIKKIFETNGTTLIRTLTSQFLLKEDWNSTGKKSPIQESVEGLIQSIISMNTDWEVCSTPKGGDSSFITPKAVVHIEGKAVEIGDGDADSKINIRSNQTSYFTSIPIVYKDIPFKSNLPEKYGHQIYGDDLVCLTYVIKVVYNLKEGFNGFENFDVYLCSLPNGKLQGELGTTFINAGKTNDYILKDSLNLSDFNTFMNSKKIDIEEKKLMTFFHIGDNKGLETTYRFLNEIKDITKLFSKNHLVNEIDETTYSTLIAFKFLYKKTKKKPVTYRLLTSKELRKSIKDIYEQINFNNLRDNVRFDFSKIPNDGTNKFKWERYIKLELC